MVPRQPHTQRVLRELIAERHEAFGSPAWFHLGCDEANRPPCPLCAEHPRAKLVADHIAGMAAWGTSAKGRDAFANALRTVDNDMGVQDYRDTGVVNRQTVPESFLK